MQLISSLVALCVASAAFAAPGGSDSYFPPTPGNNGGHPGLCTPASHSVPFLRAYNPTVVDHFYTTSAPEMANAVQHLGYNQEGAPGRVFTSQVWGAVPFYRAYQGARHDHFYTTNEAEWNNAVANLGYSREGISGYIYPTQICGSVPLYRAYQPNTVDHFYTTNQAEWNHAVSALGYNREGIAGYILPL
ncbi:hypothetical protein NP233_g1426 [Leucocoprinus birnbaumii]|uniref:DUF5648 domain-containing protein n=1 Tax=Leucocoprinus birnbaumii TaxID=56174 RepID=A0AAD5W457_9AGAR|nr:hypothetical protein NP233_g1426 [Leucocoprinus birnbaumii]